MQGGGQMAVSVWGGLCRDPNNADVGRDSFPPN